MGGINSLGELNKVSVDFRPGIGPETQKTGNANQPQPEDIHPDGDGTLEDSGTDWTPLVRRLETALGGAQEAVSVIWP